MVLEREKLDFVKPNGWDAYIKQQPQPQQSYYEDSKPSYSFNETIEREILGSMINIPTCLYEGIKQLKPHYFKNEFNNYVFELLSTLFAKNITPLMTDLVIENRKQKKMQSFAVLIADLSWENTFMPIYNFDRRVKILKEHYVVDLYNSKVGIKKDFDDVINSFEIYDLVNAELTGNGEALHIADVANKSYTQLMERQDALKEGRTVGIASGLSVLDNKTGGFRSGELIIIAGRPSMGKTAVALHIAKKVAQAEKFVTFFSLEMEDVSLYDRLVLAESGVDAQRYKNHILHDYEIKAILDAGKKLSNSMFYIDDQPKVNLNYIKTTTTLKRNIGQCDLIVIDYLQLADVNKNGLSREQAIAETTRELKILAKNLGIPIILLSQLNREVEDKELNIPQLSNLRESGAIEQDADTVLLLTRPAYYGIAIDALRKKFSKLPETIFETEGLMLINIAKQRSGSTGVVFCKHNTAINNFWDIDEQEASKDNEINF